MTQVLRQRIGERIGLLKISWRQASIDAGLGAGFIQDIITGSAKDPSEEALARLAAVLKCSPDYLLGLTGDASPEAPQPILKGVQRPDAVMTLQIVDELLSKGHIEAASLVVKRALKGIQANS